MLDQERDKQYRRGSTMSPTRKLLQIDRGLNAVINKSSTGSLYTAVGHYSCRVGMSQCNAVRHTFQPAYKDSENVAEASRGVSVVSGRRPSWNSPVLPRLALFGARQSYSCSCTTVSRSVTSLVVEVWIKWNTLKLFCKIVSVTKNDITCNKSTTFHLFTSMLDAVSLRQQWWLIVTVAYYLQLPIYCRI